ncbi:MAG: flotillin family protein [Chloroflexi bacterium]|nr:MAG: flotillin family protein [Chloroflexota bacterium]
MIIGAGAGVGGAIALVIVVALVFRAMWRVAEPNEAMIISGFKHEPVEGVGESMGFKIVTGKGVLVLPGFQRVRTLSLDANETELNITCVTTQGIPVIVKAVVIYKVGDDFVSISNAGRRFLDKAPEEVEQKIKNVFEGHLRSIVGGLTVEQMIRDREALTERTRSHSAEEMQKLGLVIDTLQIKEIDDPTGYIKSLAAPHAAAVQKEARIAQASADREATEQEQAAEALKAAARREAEIKKAGYQAEIDRAQREAAQAGPLAEQIARQRVVEEQTKVAELEAQRTEQALQAEVRKPADAEAYKQRTLAQAERDARISRAEAGAKETQKIRVEADAQAGSTRAIGTAQADATQARGLAEAKSTEARGLAEAAAIKARAEALAVNQEAVIAQQLAEQAVNIVAAAAKPVGDIDNLVVFNGTDGIQDAVLGSIAKGFTTLQAFRSSLAPGSVAPTADQNGRADAAPDEPPAPGRICRGGNAAQ